MPANYITILINRGIIEINIQGPLFSPEITAAKLNTLKFQLKQ